MGAPVLGLDRKFDAAAPCPGVTLRTVDLLTEADVRQALTGHNRLSGASIALLINAVGLIWNEPILSPAGAPSLQRTVSSPWRSVTDANLTAPFIVAISRVAARMVRRGGGSIAQLFLHCQREGNVGQAAVRRRQGVGVEGLTRTMAIELGPLGVRVNAIALGFIDVATTRNAVSADRLQTYVQKTPLGRLGLCRRCRPCD